MKEALFKTTICILALNFCFSSNINLSSLDFVNVDILPLEISKNNFGIRVSDVNNKDRFFFQSQNWLADNLYVFGSFSPSLKDDIDIIYNFNIAYKKKNENIFFKSTIFDLGYYYKRFLVDDDRKNKWISFSTIFDIEINEFHFLPSITYIFNDDSSETFLTLDFLKKINKNLMFKFGFKLYDLDKYETLPFMSIKYKI